MKKLLLGIMIISFIACRSKKAQNVPSDLQGYWDDYFYRTLGIGVAGYAYLIYQNGRLIAQNGSGYAIAPNDAFPKGVPMSIHTRMQIASCSKPITAVALLHLLEDKQIPLHTKVWDILKNDFKNPGKFVDQITITQLLNHRTGYNFGYIEPPYRISARQLLSQDIPNPPDAKYRYSNINTALARLVLEIISGQEYQQYVMDNILTPVGAEKMTLTISAADAIYVYNYGESEDIGKPMEIDFSEEAAAYGWYATPVEMMQFLEGVRTNLFLSEEESERMFENRLGWGKKETSYGDIYAHDGQWVIEGNVGIRTSIGLFPDDVVAVLFINSNGPFFPGACIRRGMEDLYPSITAIKNKRDSTAYVHFQIPKNTESLRWTNDGSPPSAQSPLYETGIKVKTPTTIKVRGFTQGKPTGFIAHKKID